MDEVLSTAPDIQDKPGATDLQVTAGAVEYHDVCFNYEDVELGEGYADERPVIDRYESVHQARADHTLWLALRAVASPRPVRCCRAFMTWLPDPLASTAQDVRDVTQQSLRRAIGLVQQECLSV